MILEFYPILYNHTTNPQKKQYIYKKYFRVKSQLCIICASRKKRTKCHKIVRIYNKLIRLSQVKTKTLSGRFYYNKYNLNKRGKQK